MVLGELAERKFRVDALERERRAEALQRQWDVCDHTRTLRLLLSSFHSDAGWRRSRLLSHSESCGVIVMETRGADIAAASWVVAAGELTWAGGASPPASESLSGGAAKTSSCTRRREHVRCGRDPSLSACFSR